MSVVAHGVSIGFPVYNGQEYIREAIDSLLAQTESNFELIISDNASTDATEQICREYAAKDQRVIYRRQQENIGAMPNFKFVLNQAGGKYFMWAAHDDKWGNNWLAQLLLAHRESVVLTFGEVVAISTSGEITRTCRNLGFTGGLVSRSLKFAFQDEYEGKANLFYGLFKTNVIRHILCKERSCNGFATDALILFSVLQLGEISAVNGARLYKRAGGAGDRVSKKYSLVMQITGSYLAPYYYEYIKRASTFTLKGILCLCLPLLLMHAHINRLKRIFERRICKRGNYEF